MFIFGIKWHNEQIIPVVSGRVSDVFIILTTILVSPDSNEPDENNEKSSGKTNHTLLNQPHHRKRIPKVKYTVIYSTNLFSAPLYVKHTL